MIRLKLLDRLIEGTQAISRISLWVAGAFMIATVFMIGAEVVLRKFGSGLVTGASEVGGYMLATCSVWAFSYTLLTRSNIRFDVFYLHCGPRLRAVLDFLGLLALGVFIAMVSYYSFDVLATSIRFGAQSTSSLAVPLWLPQSVWFAGLAFLCWTILVLSIRVLVALLQDDLATVSRLAGSANASQRFEHEAVPVAGHDDGRR